MKHPSTTPLVIENPTVRLSLDLYLAIGNASEEKYTAACDAIHRRFPNEELFAFYKMKRKVGELTGITFILEYLCTNGCLDLLDPKPTARTVAKIDMKYRLGEKTKSQKAISNDPNRATQKGEPFKFPPLSSPSFRLC
jgi:hypothetical protein